MILEDKAMISDVTSKPIKIFIKKWDFLKRICPKELNIRTEITL